MIQKIEELVPLIIVFSAVGILLLIQQYKEDQLKKELMHSGKEVRGCLVRKWRVWNTVKYEFQGRQYDIWIGDLHTLFFSEYNNIPILIDPQNPKRVLFNVTKNALRPRTDDSV